MVKRFLGLLEAWPAWMAWLMITAYLCFSGADGIAAPLRSLIAGQKLLVQVKRAKGNGFILKDGFKAQVISTTLQWEYIPNTNVSVPFVDLQFIGIPTPNNFTILAERSGTLKSDSKIGYVLHLPLIRVENSLLITIVDQAGHFEDWKVSVSLGLTESTIFVDETCRDYNFKIREIRRPAGPNLIYIGCRVGSGPREMSLDVLWGDIQRVEYRGQVIKSDNSVLTVPLESKKPTISELLGVAAAGEKSSYEIEYQPFVPPPYEIWGGLSFFTSHFEQSNFPGKFDQLGVAVFGQFWYRPEDVRLSLMLRGFGTLFSFSQKLSPDQGYQESVSTWFANAELRFMVLDKAGWRIDPLLGGWFYFQDVQSRNFGIQRALDPVLGFVVTKTFAARDTVGLTVREVPLQNFFNPLQYRLDQSYFEVELTYVHALKQRNRVFGTLFYGSLSFAPDGFATTYGNYFSLSGGYGW